MPAIIFTDAQEDRAFAVAAGIGSALRDARQARGQSLQAASTAMATWSTTIGRVERGADPNPKLGTIVKLLDYYGLELRVVPKTSGQPPAPRETCGDAGPLPLRQTG